MTNLKFDMTINLGSLIAILTVLVAMVAGFTKYQTSLDSLGQRLDEVRKIQDMQREVNEAVIRLGVIVTELERRITKLEGQ